MDGEKLEIRVRRWGRLPGYVFRTGLRSVRRTDLPIPPTWMSGGTTNRFLSAIGRAALRAVLSAVARLVSAGCGRARRVRIGITRWGVGDVCRGMRLGRGCGRFGKPTYLCRPPGYWAALQTALLGATRRAALRAGSASGIRQLVGGGTSLETLWLEI